MVIREKVQCGCGSVIGARGQLMHETSKTHRAWLETQAPVLEPEDELLDVEQQNILNRAHLYDDPRNVAKAVRALFSRRHWPDEDHPGTVQAWLEEHNIPIINLLPHASPDQARTQVAEQLEELKNQGWGKTWEVT